ncbi:TlpA family protein disulfide reductase [Algoriphagus hitonicola]|nr:TlpA disulfide reductase family protein [Algoriphagus hitonicola]
MLDVVNRKVLTYDDNFEFLRNKQLFKATYAPIDDFYFLWQSSKSKVGKIDLNEELFLKKKLAKQSLEQEAKWLDSLKKAGQISKEMAAFYLAKNQFQIEKLKYFDSDQGSFNALSAFDFFNASQATIESQISALQADEFGDFLIKELDPKEYSKLPIHLLQSENGLFKASLLFKFLDQELPKLSYGEADLWFEKYGSHLNSEWLEYLKERNRKLLEVEQDILVKSLEEERINFENILAQKRGKVVYVDLWAAWCVPCIKSFPYSRSLQEDYKNKGIEILYLSVDENHKFWDKVVEKYHIDFPARSFIAMNLAESKFLKELKVDFIPRFLLFDSEGKLIHPNAPKPESQEIRMLFDSLISNSNEIEHNLKVTH